MMEGVESGKFERSSMAEIFIIELQQAGGIAEVDTDPAAEGISHLHSRASLS
jgi:hypothetical protein